MIKLTKQGVRDLNNLQTEAKRPPLVEAPIEPGSSVCDLLYCRDTELWQEIKTVFPCAELIVADDWIKGRRTEVNIKNCSKRSWYIFLVQQGYAGCSLAFQIEIIQDKELVEGVMDTAAPGWRDKRRVKSEGRN